VPGTGTRADPMLLAVGTATPPDSYTQAELLARFEITDKRISSIFVNSHIDRRNLLLADLGAQTVSGESQGQLLDKHRRGALDLTAGALAQCLAGTGLDVTDIDYLCCVTTTGFLCPGLTAHVIRSLALRPDCGRVDVVGMGCNAGLNGLNPVVGWAARNPGRYAVQVCVEVCSAAYLFDGTMRSGVVNALFGDGAAAILVGTEPPPAGLPGRPLPRVVTFASRILTDAIDAMRFDWDEKQSKYSFYLDPDIPYVVGANAAVPVDELLDRHALRRRDISHWIVHSGGKKVIDGLKYNLDLTDHDLRHTRTVLRDHGNLSSASFLFSYQRLVDEGVVASGDYGVMMTMGPGTTIEAVLVQW
jgi:polyketide synthase Type III